VTDTRTLNVLVVEDDPAYAELVVDLLRRSWAEQATVEVVHDGRAALERIESTDADDDPRPDLVLLDLNLPKMSGLDVLRALQLPNDRYGFPVVIFSTSDSPDDAQACAALGATRFVTKPPRLAQLEAVLEDFGALVRR
jgi:CheY-like chemotaxis protein